MNGTCFVVTIRLSPRQKRAVVLVGRAVAGAGHGRDRPAPEVVLGEDDAGLVVGDALDAVAPLAGQFVRRLAALNA